MAVRDEPHFWMGLAGRGGWNAWLEFPAGATSHAALVEVAERLCRDFGAVVIERYPEVPSDDDKEDWRLGVGSATLMLMRGQVAHLNPLRREDGRSRNLK